MERWEATGEPPEQQHAYGVTYSTFRFWDAFPFPILAAPSIYSMASDASSSPSTSLPPAHTRSRLVATAPGSMSQPTKRRLRAMEAAATVPEPRHGSIMRSPGPENISTSLRASFSPCCQSCWLFSGRRRSGRHRTTFRAQRAALRRRGWVSSSRRC